MNSYQRMPILNNGATMLMRRGRCLIRLEIFLRMKTRLQKTQSPKTNHQRSSNFQARGAAAQSLKLGIWNLRFLWILVIGAWSFTAPAATPNVIFILADDLGYGDPGCFGQQKIKTPNIDKLALEGTRFTQAYAGCTVCAPSRCTLMTGLHTGHSPIRGNREIKPEGQEPMPAYTFTVAHLMKRAGYSTGLIGKWGLVYPGSLSTPDTMGFAYFF